MAGLHLFSILNMVRMLKTDLSWIDHMYMMRLVKIELNMNNVLSDCRNYSEIIMVLTIWRSVHLFIFDFPGDEAKHDS